MWARLHIRRTRLSCTVIKDLHPRNDDTHRLRRTGTIGLGTVRIGGKHAAGPQASEANAPTGGGQTIGSDNE